MHGTQRVVYPQLRKYGDKYKLFVIRAKRVASPNLETTLRSQGVEKFIFESDLFHSHYEWFNMLH